MIDTIQGLLGALSGGLVGLTLGLIGGGGSILAVALMVYVVGVAGSALARRLSRRGTLTTVFAALIFAVAVYMLWQSWRAF